MNLVIFGGTFDPIHNGHLRIAKKAAEKFNATVIFVLAKSPRWKNPTEKSNHRLDMLNLALKNADFSYLIEDFELNSGDDINYSIDTVKYIKKKYQHDNLYFLIGADQVNKFNEWKDAKTLASISKIVFVNRPGFELNNNIINDYNMEDLCYYESGEVSSCNIRNLKSIDIPIEVLKYIENNRLYFMKKMAKLIPEKRLNHCISVANLCLEVAIANKLANVETYFFTGLLHDLGKAYYKEDENTLSIMKKYYPQYLSLPSFSYHQFVGEYLAKSEFGIKDPEILDAIKFHCTGKADMTRLGMIVYTCDKIEPTRDFDSTWLINACLKDWKEGFLITLEDNRKYLREHNKDISNKFTDECFSMYLKD